MSDWITDPERRQSVRVGDAFDRVTVQIKGRDGQAHINLSMDAAHDFAEALDRLLLGMRGRP